MINGSDLKLTLTDVVEILNIRGFKFHLTGGLASSFYGEPRFTQDIDVVIRVAAGASLDRLIQDLSQKFIVDGAAIEDAVRRQAVFQALHGRTMIKVDFHVGEAIHGELDRSHSVEILAGVMAPLVSREDAILSKLIWVSEGSGKSRRDAKMMLRGNGEIDFAYLRVQAAQLGVEGILKEVTEELNADRRE